MTEPGDNNPNDQSSPEKDERDVSVAPDPEHPSGVYDLTEDGDALDPEDVYKQILGMRDEVPAQGRNAEDATQDQGTSPEAYEALNEKYLRSLADLDNLRKRQQKQALDVRKYGHEGAIREVLPVLDNLERAVQASPQEAEGELAKFVEGTQMIIQQFIGALGRLGVVPVEAVGKTFDPQLHEAVQEIASDEHPRNEVVYQMERGYLLHDRLLRPAKVVVSKGPEQAGESTPSDAEADVN